MSLTRSSLQMSDLINRYLSEVRATRQPLQLVTITGILQEASAELDFKTPNVLVALDTEVALTVSRLSSSLTAALNPDAALQGRTRCCSDNCRQLAHPSSLL